MPPAIAMGWPRGHPERGPVVPPATPAAGTWTPPPRTKTSGCVEHDGIQDVACSPGAYLTRDPAIICHPGYSTTVRNVPASERAAAFAEYGIAHPRPGAWELDHIIALEDGGSNDLANLFPQPYTGRWNARLKDRLETKVKVEACLGRITFTEAQRDLAVDWRIAFVRYFGAPP
jgi:hypothetical protein